jgi:proteasome lid subunit RPN8/RPN11
MQLSLTPLSSAGMIRAKATDETPLPGRRWITRGGSWNMFDGLVGTASRLLGSWQRSLLRERADIGEAAEPAQPRSYRRLERVLVTDEVSRTLFREYAGHRASSRGEEEIGWVLLGVRDSDFALVLATLPAGAQRTAGVAHVQFNCIAQALASRVVRQWDKRLVMLGVVHTHPGSLRHPSDGDFQGDSAWVGRLRGSEGIFGIGTSDGLSSNGVLVGRQPQPHVQGFGELLMSWYALAVGDRHYRPLDVQLTLGPDLALRLHEVWCTVEVFAEPLDRLCRQQAGITFDVVPGKSGSALAACLKLAEPGTALRIIMEGKEAAFYWQRGQELVSVEPPTGPLDRCVYLVLADLAGQMA